MEFVVKNDVTSIQFQEGMPYHYRKAFEEVRHVIETEPHNHRPKCRDAVIKLAQGKAAPDIFQYLEDVGAANYNDRNSIIYECFLVPFVELEHLEWRHMEADQNIAAYSSISESAFRLYEALAGPCMDFPGFRPEVDKVETDTDLMITLLRIISASTDLEWPQYEIEYRQGGATCKVDSVMARQKRVAETKPVYRESSRTREQLKMIDPAVLLDIVERDGKLYQHVCNVFRSSETSEICIGQDGQIPPLFQPVDARHTNPELYLPVARSKAHAYLQRVVLSLGQLNHSIRLNRKWAAALLKDLYNVTGTDRQINNILSRK